MEIDHTKSTGVCTGYSGNLSYGQKVKVGVNSFAIALYTITALGVLFLVLAKHGLTLTSWSPFAGSIPAEWLYTGLLVSTTLALTHIAICRSCAQPPPIIKKELPRVAPVELYKENEVVEETLVDPIEQLREKNAERVKSTEAKMLNGEYWHVNFSETEEQHPEKFLLITKDAQGAIEHRYFPSDQKREEFTETIRSDKTSGLLRYAEEEASFRGICLGLRENGYNSPTFSVLVYPTDNIARILTSTDNNTIESKYVPLEALEQERIELSKTYTECKREEWQKIPLTEKERDFLKNKLFKYMIRSYTKEGTWKEETNVYTFRIKCDYVVLFYKATEKIEVDFFKKDAPDIKIALATTLRGFRSSYYSDIN